MKDNIYDNVLDKTMKRIERASDRIAKNFKNVKPFQKEPLKNKELLLSYEMLTPDDMNQLISRHGRNAVNEFIGEMEQEKVRRQGNA